MKIQYQNDHLIIFESALFRTTSTLILSESAVLLIDPTWLPDEIDFIAAYIHRLGAKKEKFLLFTHSDYDHIIGYGQFKHFKTIASANFVTNPDSKSILDQIKKFDDEYYISRNYEIEYPRIDIAIAGDAQSQQIDGEEYLFWQAVGHNRDSIITLNQREGILVVGDYLSNIEFPYMHESVAKYRNTLAKLTQIIQNHTINILVTGHGDFTHSKVEMLTRIQDSYDYINALEAAVKQNQAFDFDKLFARYHFPKIMMQFHEGNVALMKKELDKINS